MCLMPFANNKYADQPAHPWSVISTFAVPIRAVWSAPLLFAPCSLFHSVPQSYIFAKVNLDQHRYLSHVMRKCVLCHLRTTKMQISLRIRAVWSAPLLFASAQCDQHLCCSHPRSVISTFAVRSLDSLIFIDVVPNNFNTLATFCPPKTGFLVTWLNFNWGSIMQS